MSHYVVTILLLLFSLVSAHAETIRFVRSNTIDFSHPHDLCIGPGGRYLYVADMNNDRVKVLDATSLRTLAVIGQGTLRSPHDVAFDLQGRLLVADSGNDRIVVYDVSGKSARLVSELRGGLNSPEGVTVDKRGRVYVSDTGNHSLVVFDDAKFLIRKGGHGRARGRFIRPHDIEYGPDDRLYIGDPGNNRIQIWTTALEFAGEIAIPEKPFKEPKYLALDERNRLYVADQHNNELRIFDPARTALTSINEANGMVLNRLEGVEVLANKIWLSDTYNDRIILMEWQP